jgi:ADP-ribose pyrophosphatase YjhB (NUDIX family)
MEQRAENDECPEAEVSRTLAVGAIVFDADGRVLLVQRGKPPGEGLWSVPGGRVEPGESLEQAVAREVLEETGLVVEVGPHAETITRIGETYHYEIHDHVARVLGGTLTAGDDARDVRWASAAELAALPTTEGLLPVVERARATYGAWSASM